MKSYLAATAVVLAATAGAAAPPDRPARDRPPPDLRQAVQQYHPGSTQPPPRQLSAEARAQLRRQLGDLARQR